MSAQTQHHSALPCVRMTHNLYTIMQAQKWKNYIAEICAAIYIEQSLLKGGEECEPALLYMMG